MLVSPRNFLSSPNFGRGRKGTKIKNVVIYCLRNKGLVSVVDACTRVEEDISYHFIIGVDGKLVQTVRIINTAFSCKSDFGSVKNENNISIALVGAGNIFTNAQYTSLYRIIFLLIRVIGIKEECINYYDSFDKVCLQSCSWEKLTFNLFSASTCKNPFII